MSQNYITSNIQKICEGFSEIKLCYFFGSRANKTGGRLSDYDFAFYLEEKNPHKRFDLKLDLINKISKKLKTEKVDVVILNDTETPELKFEIIKSGKLIYEKEPYRVLIEPRIMNEYIDFREGLRHYGLTKA